MLSRFISKILIQKIKMKKLSKDELIEKLRKQMEQATKELDYERAMEIRDIIIELREGNISKSKES